MLRLLRIGQRKDERVVCPKLTMHELGLAEDLWWRIVQQSEFLGEIADLKKGGRMKHCSKILTIHPFLDAKCLLRVGAREN